jgi:hypothetical protein
MKSDTKLAKVRSAMRDGDWDTAFRLAARFQRLGVHAEAIRRAADAAGKPAFYRQIGYDLDEVRAAGIAALKERFSKSWEDASDSGVQPSKQRS